MTDTEYKPLILLADDDPDYHFLMKFALEKAGYRVVTAESMEEAEVIIDKIHPRLAIFDLMMERGGFDESVKDYPELRAALEQWGIYGKG